MLVKKRGHPLLIGVATSLAILFGLFFPHIVGHAAETDRVWIRAKLEYQTDDVTSDINEEAMNLHEPKLWEKKDDGWAYYKTPVESGDKVRILDGFSIPASWDNRTANHKFAIVVSVEAAEVVPGDTGWDSNSQVVYSTTYDVWRNQYSGLGAHQDVKQSTIDAVINEYELDENGKEVKYKNDKLVTPGDKISKIVEIEIMGEKGGIFNIPWSRQTGDAATVILWIILAAAAAAVIAATLKKRRIKTAVSSKEN